MNVRYFTEYQVAGAVGVPRLRDSAFAVDSFGGAAQLGLLGGII
jgi:hypothetical protein